MAKANAQRRPKEAKLLADLVGKAMTPACRKRGFASVDIVAAWAEIVGERYGARVQPVRLIWPRKPEVSDPEALPQPATLIVHTDGATALLLSHDSARVIERINTFYGWAAVGRIKILQRPVTVKHAEKRPPSRSLTKAEERKLERTLEGVHNERLRLALKKLGAQIIAKNGDGQA